MPTPPAASLPPIADALRDRYRFERIIGSGGMATVCLAHDLKHGRPVAVKVLRDGDAPVDVERFHREIRVLARLRHPFILPLYDSGEAAGSLFFVMPYVDGESLRSRLERQGRVPLGDALEIAYQVLDALQTAHDEGVVHRDVKPENILIARSGHALLADFGIARAAGATGARAETMTQAGMALGTVAYMSPEQALGEPEIDARADIYAMACVVFEMLAGAPPFAGGTAMNVLSRHVSAPAPDVRTLVPDAPPAVAQALLQAMAKDPTERQASARDLARALLTTGQRRSAEAGASPLTGTVATRRLSLAVLPFANMSGAPDGEYFGDGLTEELTTALSRLEGLRVVSRTSAASFRGQALPLTAIASKLGVEFVVEGSVRRVGQRMRLTAKLIRASEDAPLWSETFDRTLEDVFAVQDEITARVVDTIAQALQLGRLRGQVPVATTRNLEAYDLYLLGRHNWYERTESGMRRARERFQQAIDLDAAYAPAWSGLADASALLASWQFADAAEMYPVATAAARRALELDESLAEAHASLGFVKMNWEWDWEGVLRELQRAISLNPNHETAHRWLSAFLAGIGRSEEALPIAQRALLLDPVSILPRMNLGIIHYLSGDQAAGESEIRRVLQVQPGFARAELFLSATLSLQGRHDEACRVMEDVVARDGRVQIYLLSLGLAYGMAGRMREAREVLEPIIRSNFPRLYVAIAHNLFGETDEMYRALEQGIRERSDWMYSLGTQPMLANRRGEPRFRAVLAKLGLPGA